MEHMVGGGETGKIWFQMLRISMPVLFFSPSGHGKEQYDCFELKVHMQNVIMEKLSSPEVFTERLDCCLA